MTYYAEVVFNIPVDRTFVYSIPEGMDVQVGMRVRAPLGRRMLTGFVVGNTQEPPQGDFVIKALQRLLDKEPVFDSDHVALARWVAKMYLCSLGETLSAMLPGGLRESDIPVFDEAEVPDAEEHPLALQQKEALEAIEGDADGFFYLYGVTGSGKTEVFLQTAKKILSEGRSVIYLVPEISLTHQVVEAVKARFGDEVAVLHSGLTPSQRFVEWMRIRNGEARFVVGARSAVFAPVCDLGLIIIDEEHEGSYKSGSTPRYHARQVAMYRCTQHQCRLIMGSATPSVEAFHLMHTGRLHPIHLPDRLSGGKMPQVKIIDMKKEQGALSSELAHKIRATNREGRQTILFLNRRGFSYFFHCRSCGFEMKCKNCSVSLTYHKRENIMLCHYCGFRVKPVQVCPECGSLDVGYSGFGTEHIEEEVKKTFPELTVARVDSDTVKKRGTLKQVLASFRSGEIDILLGTQMVAKGLNFPGVKLIGIVLADTGLHLPDFRASERTFSLIVQVSGRAGRFAPDGEVYVQTYKPQEPAIRLAAGPHMETFYQKELEIREFLEFPPFTRIFRIVFRGKNKRRAEQWIAKFASLLTRDAGEETQILGPAECPLAVISGNYRFQLIVRTTTFSRTHRVLRAITRDFAPPQGVYMEIDVDPVSLL